VPSSLDCGKRQWALRDSFPLSLSLCAPYNISRGCYMGTSLIARYHTARYPCTCNESRVLSPDNQQVCPVGPLGFDSHNIAQRHALHVERTVSRALEWPPSSEHGSTRHSRPDCGLSVQVEATQGHKWTFRNATFRFVVQMSAPNL
jgi:hypothetical protein